MFTDVVEKNTLFQYINSLAMVFNSMNSNVTKLFEINAQNMLNYIKKVEITIFSWTGQLFLSLNKDS